jgi:hypothetical protein
MENCQTQIQKMLGKSEKRPKRPPCPQSGRPQAHPTRTPGRAEPGAPSPRIAALSPASRALSRPRARGPRVSGSLVRRTGQRSPAKVSLLASKAQPAHARPAKRKPNPRPARAARRIAQRQRVAEGRVRVTPSSQRTPSKTRSWQAKRSQATHGKRSAAKPSPRSGERVGPRGDRVRVTP